MSSTASKPLHVTESIADRKAAREIAEARQSGTVAPQVDVKTNAIINPHNPEFITKRPWYLGNNDEGPSLDHQTLDPNASDRQVLTITSADQLIKQERQKEKEKRKKGQFEEGMWVEALKNNKGTYRICKIIKLVKNGTVFDLEYEDGTVEKKVKFKPGKGGGMFKPRIRMTKSGTRSLQFDSKMYGKETYDSKRDEYHGYDADSHTKKVEQIFKEREEMRQKLREESKQKQELLEGDGGGEKKAQAVMSDSDLDSDVEGSDDDSDDEFAQKEEKVFTSRLARQGGVGGAQMKVTARNLRIREDTAKYLRNLDPNSAYYDPKSRSMRDNPNPELPPEELQFAGDNFARISGDAVDLASTQLFAWDAAEKGVSELHPQANPSQVELLKKKFKSKSTEIQLQKKKKVLDKYGGSEYLDGSGGLANAIDEKRDPTVQANSAEERKIRFGVSTVAEEYGRDGRVLKGLAKVKRLAQKSKYEEDIFINGHTTVWGSYFHVGAFAWGYADDHSLIRSSYCTGETGRKANDEANEMRYGTGVAGSAALAQARGMIKAMTKERKGDNGGRDPPSNKSKLYGEADQKAELDKSKVKAALEKYEHDQAEKNSNKRKYHSLDAEVDVTEEEMEAYRLRKERSSDPMVNIGSDELLDYEK
ncbi:pre-mRNA splicing Prp18-interacting factor [Nitzschia inconspicua]|uniref:Pre-mRNA-splicing factor SLU7 n=1 Tax=Nitzschia inconspicua TaxID=303405 RepID=A0A9K3LBZ0_9STRA|nr:pre-mRNA splicing Prp18-interacting factor [Nitzschia inconspicua]